jgi:hypothetical protein
MGSDKPETVRETLEEVVAAVIRRIEDTVPDDFEPV